MIEGTVIDLQGRVEVTFRLSGQSDRTIECVLDTGFQGELALPPATVAALGLSAGGRMWASLADDSDVSVPLFHAVIDWDKRDVEITVMAMGSRPLLGPSCCEGSI
jgi:predicted aspartyl protease